MRSSASVRRTWARVCEDVRVLRSGRRKRGRLQSNFCRPVSHVSCSVCPESFYLFIIFFLYLDPRISECRPPPSIGCRSLDRPKKNLGISSLAVNREILCPLSCNTSDVSQSCSVMKSLEEWHCGGVSDGGGALCVHITEKVELIQHTYNGAETHLDHYQQTKICRRVFTAYTQALLWLLNLKDSLKYFR